jgi:hypothetical protein
MVDSEGETLPLIELAGDQRGYLTLATVPHDLAPWRVRQVEPVANFTPLRISNLDTAVVINTITLQILSPMGSVVTIPIRPSFDAPLVATVVGPQTVVVLGKNGTLWVNTRKGVWRRLATRNL